MTRKERNGKLLRRRKALARYSAKRRTLKWKMRKKAKKLGYKVVARKERQRKLPPITMSSPKSLCLLSSTNEVLSYLSHIEEKLRKGVNVNIDISDAQALTPETVAFLVANIADPDFLHQSIVFGNAPNNPALKKLFTESGFYDHVNGNSYFSKGKESLLHKEVHHKVEPKVAMDAALVGIRHVFGNDKPFEPLYEILIECMSNTNDHADPQRSGKCRWWLYVYSDPDKKISSYTFIDLGVGIFKSAIVQNHLKNLFKGTVLYKNINLVDNLLSGKIQSRIGKDKEIRGKGIPQIVEHSKSPNFRNFYIISNDVKIDLKTGAREQLEQDLWGTLLYWELQE